MIKPLRRQTGSRPQQPASRAVRGAASVELALLLGPLVLAVFATVELGRAVHTFNTLGKGVRDAARHLSQFGASEDVVHQARCVAVHGSLDCSGPARVPGLSTRLIQVCDAQRCATTHAGQSTGLGAIALVSVEVVGYRWASLLGTFVPDMAFPVIAATMRAPQ